MSDDPPVTLLTFSELRGANLARLKVFPGHSKGEEPWTPNDWMVAVTGEVGELANKLKRIRRGVVVRGKPLPTPEELEGEFADIVIYLDLLAARMSVDLGTAVRRKFNLVSDEIGVNVHL